MSRLLLHMVLLAFAVSTEVRADLPVDCLPISGSNPIQGPAQANSVRLTDLDGNILAGLEFSITGGKWSPNENAIAKIEGALAARRNERAIFRLMWFQDTKRLQTDRFVMPDEDEDKICAQPQGGSTPPPAESGPIDTEIKDDTGAQPSDAHEQCQDLFQEWNEGINSRLGHERYLAILFGPNGQILAENKDYGVAGDLIYTAVCQDERVVSPPVIKFTKCDLQSATPKNPEGEAFVPQAVGVIKMKRIEFPVRQCFGTSAEVKVTVGNTTETHPIGLYERYRYTLQVAALNTDQHVHAFGLRKDGDDNKIFDKGPIDDGPEYSAAVVLYALPRYISRLLSRNQGRGLTGLEALANRTYHGRDVVNDHAAADRLGLVFGAGLDHPRDRFVAGLSFELIPGVNIVGVYEWAKLKELAGTEEDAVFTGTAEQIPQRDSWKGKVVFGVSLDMRYVTGLFKRAS